MVRILLSRKLGELRLTQADLARKTGIRPSTIGAYYYSVAQNTVNKLEALKTSGSSML